MDSATEDRIELQADKLGEHTLSELSAMHEESFGVPYRGKDKRKIALKLARNIVTGNGAGKTAGPDAAEDELAAREALMKAKSAHDEVERLLEEKKTKLAGIRKTIRDTDKRITELLGDDAAKATEKADKFEQLWRGLKRSIEKKKVMSREFNADIKAAQQSMKSVFDNVRQIPLGF